MIVVEILGQLLFPSLVVLISMPYLEFNDKLLSEIINNDIRAPLIPCLRFDIVISCSVDDWL